VSAPSTAAVPSEEPSRGAAGPWDEPAVDAATIGTLGKQGPFRPLVRLLETGGERLVAKDYRACTPLYRWTIGAWSLAREAEALQRLQGIDGFPQWRGRAGRWTLVMTHLRGRDLGKVRRFRQTPEFFDLLMALVERMHERGVVHLDLRQRRNILFRWKGAGPAVLDFGSALCLRPGSWLHRRLVRIDVSGVLKYKRRAMPDALSRDEKRALRKVEKRRKWWPFS
jgi:RIO-like serine/threonine protein kinase